MSRMIRISDGCYVAGLRHTDPFDSARVGDYNNGWNDRHMAAIAQLSEERILELAEPFGEFRYGDAQGDKRVGFARAVAASLSAVPSAPSAPKTDDPAGQWVAVSERLPQIKQVLSEKCTLEGRDIPTLYRSGEVLTFDGKRVSAGIVEWFHAKSPLSGVTHWMPLPAAPAPGKREGE